MPTVTLNDFKAILGNVNDGNVVLTTDKQGIEKANHGGFLSRAIHNYRTAENKPDENRQIRKMLMAAISNSEEGKSLTDVQLASIRDGLGIGRRLDEELELGRGELKIVLDTLEAMQLTNALPTLHKNGSVTIPKRTNANTPLFGNRMIERQFQLIVAKTNIPEQAVSEAFNKVIGVFKKRGSKFGSAKDMISLLPDAFHGHSHAEMAKFVNGNRAMLGAALVDTLVWKLMDGAQSQPGQKFNLSVRPREVFLETLDRLMTTYAEKKDPVPRAVTLLTTPAEVAEPEDEAEKLAFDKFRDETTAKLEALFPPQQLVTFQSRQFLRFRKHVKAEILAAYKRAYEAVNGTAVERAAGAAKAVREMFPLLLRYSAAEMKELAKSGVFTTSFTDAMAAAIAKMETADGAPTHSRIKKTFNDALSALDEKMSLEPVVEAYVDTMNLGPEQTRTAHAALLKALNEAGAQQAELVAGLRLRMLGAVNANEPGAVRNAATSLVSTSAAFRTFAEGVTKEFINPDVVRAQRDEIFKTAGEAMGRLGRPWADTTFTPYKSILNGLENDWKYHPVSEDDKKAILKSLEPYKKLGEDKVFLGKLAVLYTTGKLVPNTELYDKLMDRDCCFKRDADTLVERKRIVEELVDALSITEIKNRKNYMAWQLDEFDTQYGYTIGPRDAHVFLDLVSDGSVDFAAIPDHARHFLMSCVFGAHCSIKAEDPTYFSVIRADIPQDTLRMLYDEEREAVRILAGNDAEEALESRNLSAERMPDNFDPALLSQERDGRFTKFAKGSRLHELRGFGTTDVHAILNALNGIGVTPANLTQPENWLKMFRLQVLTQAHGGHLDGVVEWAERMTGKDFNDIRMVDCEKLFTAATQNEIPVDPVTQLEGNRKTISDFLGGMLKTDEAGLNAEEMPNLLAALRSLASGTTDRATVKFFGEDVTFIRRPNGQLTAKLTGEAKLSLTVTRSAGEIIAQIENEMTTHVSRYGAASVKAILPPVPKSGQALARPRELYAKTLSSVLGLPVVNFAHLGTAKLYETVLEAFVHSDQVKASFAEPPMSYNNAEAVEMQERYLVADSVERSLVIMPKKAEAKSLQERMDEPTTPEDVRAFVADLIMNKDTWAFDSGNRVPGQRLETLLNTYQPELQHIKANPELLDTLPTVMRTLAKDLIDRLNAVDPKAKNVRSLLAEIEKTIDAVTEKAMAELQAKATTLFSSRAEAQRPLWQQSLGEMSGASGGIDTNTAEGRFLKAVLDGYFTRCSGIEKRAMLSAYLRNTDAQSSDGRQVAEMLKGAGPLLQKMLQKLSPDMFDEETRIAIKDMKSKLAPIPDAVIEAQLLELVRNSHGQILSVEVIKSIGQASVGQALLCHIRTKEHPTNGEDVVIKLLRPNVQTAVQREHKLLLEIARELDARDGSGTSQQTTFEGRYASILEEFDFTLEAENIDMGLKAYERPTVTLTQDGHRVTNTYDTVHSMNRLTTVDPCSGMLVLAKVDGEPVDRLLETVQKRTAETLKPITHTTQLPGGDPVTTYEATSVDELVSMRYKVRIERDTLVGQRESVAKLLDAWFERALFGDGVFHNDLHPGNVMIKDKHVTVIDFGNVMRLTKKEQSELVFTFLAAMRGKPDAFLASIGSLLDDKGKAVLKDLDESLKRDLKTVFSKGTSRNVLPRALAAMALLQKRGVPIPEAVHNFAQSLERIHGVIATIDTGIADLERISREMRFTDELAAKYDTKHPENSGYNVQIGLCNKMDTIFRLQGDPENGIRLNELQNKADALAEEIHCSLNVNNGFGVITGVDQKTKKEVTVDPMDTAETKGAKSMGRGVAPFCAEMRSKVFSQPDGGVAFLKAFLAKYEGSHGAFFGNTLGVPYYKPATLAGLHEEELPLAIRTYEDALKADPQIPENIAKAQKEVLRWMLTTAVGFAVEQGGELHTETVSRPGNLDDFESLVGKTLGDRGDSLAVTMGEHQGIAKAKVLDVMEQARNGTAWPVILWNIGIFDAPKFNALKNLGDELEKLNTIVENLDKRLRKMTKAANDWAAKLPKEEQIPDVLRKKIRTSALDVRIPMGWKPSLADAKGKAQFQEILSLALAKVRDAIKPAELTPSVLKYFARLYAGTSSLTGLPDELRKPENAATVDAWLDELQLAAGRNEVGADPQLVDFVTALRDTSWTIPPFPQE